MKKKSRRLGLYKKDAISSYSIFIRTRDCIRTTGTTMWGLCITCDRRYHFKVLQAGHFIPGRRNANLFYERGCHAQCYNCNVNLKGNFLNYLRAIIRLYGQQIIEELESNNKLIVKYKKHDYISIMNEYKEKTKKLKEQVGLC